LTPWVVDEQVIGVCWEVESPREIWLVLHGNGGQAGHRGYLLQHIGPDTSLYVLEYPGYGARSGKPSMNSINAAAREAWTKLEARYPGLPKGVIGESIGTGAACVLANEAKPPVKIVLLTPYDQLVDVAREKFRWLPVGLLLQDKWDNGAALRNYGGTVEIYAAADDEVIPIHHARSLHERVPNSQLIEMPGGHNTWQLQVRFKVMPTVTEN
jgi:pimeloyl-ACP methyl ester carboxylesterase